VAHVAPCNCVWKARTKRAACAIGASSTVKFTGDQHGRVRQLHAVRVDAKPGTGFTMDADLVLLAWASSAR